MRALATILILPLAAVLCTAAFVDQDPPKPKAAPKVAQEPKEVPKADKELAAKKSALEGRAIPSAEIKSAIERGIALLVERQESLDESSTAKSEWPYEGVVRVEGQIPIGYRIGGTSICACALIDASGGKPRPDVKAAIERALDFVLVHLDDKLMNDEFGGSYDVRGWGHAFGLSFLLKLCETELVPERQAKAVAAMIPRLITTLEQTEIKNNGGWNYARGHGVDDSTPATFMMVPTLQILFEARRQGFDVDAKVVQHALDALEKARLSSGAFQYSSNPAHQTGKGFEDVPGAIGRTAACEATLMLAGRGNVEHVRGAIEAFFEHWEWLELRRKQQGTHVPPYMIAPYYYFYAHRYVAEAIEMLPEKDRAAQRERLYKLLWKVREQDGGWNDRVFPRSEDFGTAMTIFALLAPSARAPAGWQGAETPATK